MYEEIKLKFMFHSIWDFRLYSTEPHQQIPALITIEGFKPYISAFGGAGGKRQNDDTADAWGGAGGSKPKCWHADTLKGELKHRWSIGVKLLKLSMN